MHDYLLEPLHSLSDRGNRVDTPVRRGDVPSCVPQWLAVGAAIAEQRGEACVPRVAADGRLAEGDQIDRPQRQTAVDHGKAEVVCGDGGQSGAQAVARDPQRQRRFC